MTEKEFEEIYNYYFQDVYKFSLSLSKNKDIAEEITAETFFKAIKYIDNFRERVRLKFGYFKLPKINTIHILEKIKIYSIQII
ncbi:MAG: RNA polymerase sigma factor [Peptoniphilaceae bacterium]